jgi:hypothetical protein
MWDARRELRDVDAGYQMQDVGFEEDPFCVVVITVHSLTIFAAFLARYSRWMVRDRVSGNVSSIVLPLTIVIESLSRSRFLLATPGYSVPATATTTATSLRLCPCVSACLRVCVSGRLSWCDLAQTVSEAGGVE